MRKLLNKALRGFGYELRRVDWFDEFAAELMDSPRGLKFVQVGAHDGVSFDGMYRLATAQPCAGLAIEPLPDAYASLCRLYADRPQIVPVNVAIHATDATRELFRVAEDLSGRPRWAAGIASFDRNHLIRHGVPESAIRSERVRCVDLMTLLETHGFLDANLLHVDVEGYDAEVVRMLDLQRFRPRLIRYEHKNLSANDAQDVWDRLSRAGYRMYRSVEDAIGWQPS